MSKPGPKPLPLAIRIERHIARPNGLWGCWLWTGSVEVTGYGKMGYVNGRNAQAHRIAYEVYVGPIPDGLVIDHLCRNPRCVNPAHLEAVTMRENTMRGLNFTAQNVRKTHCLRGHPFDEANTTRHGNHRGCRECNRIRANMNYHRRKQRQDTGGCDPTPSGY